jgi:hypothetical protein
MSIRVSTGSMTRLSALVPSTVSDPMGQKQWSSFALPMGWLEASPIYASVSTRLRITGGADNGYDGTATWTRTNILPDMGGGEEYSGVGWDVYSQLSDPPAGQCNIYVDFDAESGFGFGPVGYYRDPKKQRVKFHADLQSVTSGAITKNLSPPKWLHDLDIYPDYRTPLRWFGLGYTDSGGIPIGVDSTAFTAATWRDIRGTYAASYYAAPGVLYEYEWTI